MAEPLNATFFAFRKREKGGVLVRAAITYLVLMVLLLAALIGAVAAIGGAGLAQVAMDAQSDPEAIQSMITPGMIATMLLVYFGFLFVIFIVLAAYEAACLRWMVRGETKGLFGFALDADTWRVYGIYWVWLIGCVVGIIGLVLLMGLLASVLHDTPLMLALPFLLVIIPIYVSVRLAPAAATAIAEQRFAFFDAWKVSHDRFWALFGSFLLLWLIYVVLVLVVTGGWTYWAYGPHLAEILAASEDPVAMSMAVNKAMAQAMATPMGLVSYIAVQIASLVIGVTFYIALFGVNARAASAALEEGKITPETAT